MADLLVELSSRPGARRLLGRLGLPLPVPLRRAEGPWTDRPLEGRQAVVGGAPSGFLHPVISQALARAGARSTLVGLDEAAPAYAEAGEGWGRPFSHVDEPAPDLRPDLLVFDGTGLADPADLKHLFRFFQPLVRGLARNGRVVILGLDPKHQPSAEAAAAQAALDGFVRSLGKELGRKGATANRIVVGTDAEERVEPVLRWLLSDRSAFVNLQTLPVSRTVAGSSDAASLRPLDGKLALVTGAVRGIGEATARRLAEEGAKVVVLDRPEDQDAATALARQIGGLSLGLDITASDAPERLVGFLKENLGGLDILVHNAGITRDRTLGRMDASGWDLAMEVNLLAVLRITRRLDEQKLLQPGGRVVLLSSIAGISGNAGQTNYAASKAGLLGALGCLGRSLGRRGITVNAIAPGFIETRLTAAIPIGIREVGRRLSALSQGGQPRDVAEAITFLSSPGAIGLDGVVLRVCGGSFIGA